MCFVRHVGHEHLIGAFVLIREVHGVLGHELADERGVLLEALEESTNESLDPFDLICHVAFDRPPLTRRERADNVRKRNVFTKYGEQAREVLGALLDKYADQGLESMGEIEVLKLDPFPALGTTVELVKRFGGRDQYLAALREIDAALYEPA